jgi:hypothetical protein
MGRTPTVALAGIFLAGLGLTGCESCSLFGANKPWRQDQAASSTPGTSGWQNQPKTATAGSADVAKTTTLGQSTTPDAGFGRSPASGFSGLSPAPNQNATGTASGNAFAPNSTAPTGNGNSFGQTSAPSPSSSFSNNMPYGTQPSGDAGMGVSRTTFPQANTSMDWNRNPNAGAAQLSAPGVDRTTALPGAGSPSSSTAPAPSGLQTPSFPGQSSSVNNSQYQTQYPTPPASEGVKTMPPPGQGDQ